MTRAYWPADVDDLCAFVAAAPADEPLMLVGLGSNLLVRDGGIAGVVDPEENWARIEYFLKRVVPVATANRIRLACHPHDRFLAGQADQHHQV